MKVAVISSAEADIDAGLGRLLERVVSELARVPGIEILTGGCQGILGAIAKKARRAGIRVTAFSPDGDADAHDRRHDNLPAEHFDEIVHHEGFTMRSMAMLEAADAVLTLGGRMGTLSEFAIALEEGKKVVVLTGAGGISDHLEQITAWTGKLFGSPPRFTADPAEAVRMLG